MATCRRPANGLEAIIDACCRLARQTQPHAFEYVMLDGVNDTLATPGASCACSTASRRRSI
jgi:adenine C2-methylase RlmN of 23S rRNA A2503 and tRNA A37